MDFKQLKVLVTDGSARQTLTILHGLKDLGCHITILCPARACVGYASNIPDERIVDSRAAASHDEFGEYLIQVLKKGSYDVLIPVAEGSTNKVTLLEDEVKKYVRLACAPRESYINAYDKQRTFNIAIEKDIPRPYTRRQDQTVDEFLKTATFPLIIKPRHGVGSIGFHKFNDREGFWPYIKENNIDLDTYVLQEFVPHEKRLGTILFVDQNGDVCMAYADEVLRWYPLDAGSATTIRSIDYPEIIDYSAELLKAMKWQGVAALSFMVDKFSNEPKLLEINGRIPASIRLSYQCGFNVARMLIEMAYDTDVTHYPNNTRFGQVTRHFHAEIPWFIKSPTRFSSDPSWFSWKNTKDVIYWRGDFKPWIAYTWQKIGGYRSFKKKRSH